MFDRFVKTTAPAAAFGARTRRDRTVAVSPMSTVRRMVLLALAALALSGCQPRQTGMFSTLELDKDGLLYGYEIFIVKADRGAGQDYYAIVQCADGKAGPPTIGQVTMTADQVRIALPSHATPGCPSSTFVGTVGFKELAGHFAGGEQLALARKYSFWE